MNDATRPKKQDRRSGETHARLTRYRENDNIEAGGEGVRVRFARPIHFETFLLELYEIQSGDVHCETTI